MRRRETEAAAHVGLHPRVDRDLERRQLVLTPARIAGQDPRSAAVVVCLRVARVELDRSSEVPDGVRRLTRRDGGVSAVEIQLRVTGREQDRPVVIVQRAGDVTEADARGAAIAERVRRVRIALDRLVEGDHRSGVAAFAVQSHTSLER